MEASCFKNIVVDPLKQDPSLIFVTFKIIHKQLYECQYESDHIGKVRQSSPGLGHPHPVKV